jgi:hypothetical protein
MPFASENRQRRVESCALRRIHPSLRSDAIASALPLPLPSDLRDIPALNVTLLECRPRVG